MKRLLFLLVVGSIVAFSVNAFADSDFIITREKAAPKGRYRQLKQTDILTSDTNVIASITEPVNIYRILVTGASAPNSALGIYDSASYVTATQSECAFEMYEATAGDGYYLDFGDDPIRLTTGMAVKLTNVSAVIHYLGQDAD